MSLLTQALVGLLLAVSAVVAEPQNLTIVVSPAGTESSPAVEAMRRETARLVSPADYAVAWVSKGQAALGDSFEQLVVVRFRGVCQSQAEQDQPLADSSSLATTAVSNGQVLPFVDVDCDRTRRLIAPALTALPSAARETLFGRALGRVLAHELYHVLAQTKDHKDHGVSKPCFRVADLVSTRFRFDAVSLAQMRPAPQLARQAQPPAPVDLDAAADDAAGR